MHVPTFFSRQTLVKEVPGAKTELPGTLTSATTSIRSHDRSGVGVCDCTGARVGVRETAGVRVGVRVEVNVSVGVLAGVDVVVGVSVERVATVEVKEGVNGNVGVKLEVSVRESAATACSV